MVNNLDSFFSLPVSRRELLRRGGLVMGALAGASLSPVSALADGTQTLRPRRAPGPLDNPLKGWCTYTDAMLTQPYRMVYRYVSWRELEPREGDFRFEDWERKTWDEPKAQGKHIIFRVYVDYPTMPSGLPDWLKAKGVTTRPYTDYGGGQSPDYNHPAFVAGMERLIAAMGARYDRNPRVAFVQLGFLGYWGEWHTYPHLDWFATPATQERVFAAAHTAFPNKVLMNRYPGGSARSLDWIGFFDDLFPQDTDGPEGWEFLPTMRKSGRTENWKRACIGGELEPGAAVKWLGSDFARTLAMTEATHFSWVGPYSPAMIPNPSPILLANSQSLVRRMGYEFRLTEIRCPQQIKRGAKIPVTISGVNQGVAPFYYSWSVELALLDAQNRVVEVLPVKADIRKWLPGPFQLAAAPGVSIPPGRYTLALGIRDPWTKRPDIAFANGLPRVAGWTLLAHVTVTR